MNTYLKAATEQYDLRKEGGGEFRIHPISDVDASVMFEIMELFRKMNFVAAVDILKSYKFHDDAEVLQLLQDLNKNIGKARKLKSETGEEESTDAPLFKRYLMTLGRRIDMYLVISFDCFDCPAQEGSDEMVYVIKLNPTPLNAKSIPFYANEQLVYTDVTKRNEVMAKMDEYFQLYRGLFL